MELSAITRSLETLARWWAGELLALLPRALRQLVQRQARSLLVEYDGRTARFRLRGPRQERSIADLAFGPDAVVPSELAQAIRDACAGRLSDVAVRVPPALALRRALALPLAAEGNVGAVLAFEMDRYTPFKADHVYYDFAVLGREAQRRELRVALTLVPRKIVDPLLAALRRRGFEPTSLGVEGDDACNLLPAAQRGERQGGVAWPNRALAAIAALLLVAALALPIVQKLQTVTRLEQALETARAEGLRAEQVRKQLEQLVSEENALVGRRKERPAAIQVLHGLTRLLPDSTWLSHVELAGNRVKIRGESSSASELVTSIENSAMFQGASFDGSVTRNPKTDRERFALSATAQPERAR